MTQLPDSVASLLNRLAVGDLDLRVLPRRAPLAAWSWREIELTAEGRTWLVPVDDEFGDADTDNPAAWLHLIVSELEHLAEEPDLATWCADSEVPVGDAACTVYDHLLALEAELRVLIGPQVVAVPVYDLQFNTAVARALRACVGSGWRKE